MIADITGKTIPSVALKHLKDGGLQDLNTSELFTGKRVVVFALPGAFTPTCSTFHLPRYEELYSTIRKAGIDEIYCLSVNDAFIMDAWAAHHEIKHVKMLPDGNGALSEAAGIIVDKSAIGFGKRAWRCSMVINDNKIEKFFSETDDGGDPFQVSDADTMLKYLDPNAKPPHQIAMFTKTGCNFCAKARAILNSKKLPFVECPLPDSSRHIVVGAISGGKTAPQVFIDGKLIGGSDALEAWAKQCC